MRFYVAIGVASLGIGCFALAAILWDRRTVFRNWLGRKQRTSRPSSGPFAGMMGVLLVLGLGLIVGSCVGLISF